jgi:hypothetical protein
VRDTADPQLTADLVAQVVDTLHRYAEAVDSRDPAQITSVLAAGVLLTRGEVVTEGVEAFVEAYRPFLEADILASRHVVLNPIVESSGPDAATVRSCFQATTFTTGATRQVFGRYVDDVVRVDGRWLVSHKRNYVEWAVDLPAATALQL